MSGNRQGDRRAVPAELADNQLVMLCRHVFSGERPVRHLEPTEEGILVAACGETDHGDGPADWLSGGFGALAARDPSLRSCPSIPLGSAAERRNPGEEWVLTEGTPSEGSGDADGEA